MKIKGGMRHTVWISDDTYIGRKKALGVSGFIRGIDNEIQKSISQHI